MIWAACRTDGVDNGTLLLWSNGLSSWTTSVSYHTVTTIYSPILLPPEQSTVLNPQWEACTAWDNHGDNAYDVFYGLYDPPCALTAAPALIEPSTTSPNPTARQTSPAPQTRRLDVTSRPQNHCSTSHRSQSEFIPRPALRIKTVPTPALAKST